MLIVLFSLISALLTAPVSHAATDYSGIYKLANERCSGTLEAKREDVRLAISLEVSCGASPCKFQSSGPVVDKSVVLTAPEYPDCRLTVAFDDAEADVKQEGGCAPCKTSMAGRYAKEKPRETGIAVPSGPLSLTGTINQNLKVKMSLKVDGSSLSGSYFYERHKIDIRLDGSVDGEGNVTMKEYDAKGNQTGLFKGKFVSAQKIEGVWTKPDGSKPMPFSLESDQSTATPPPLPQTAPSPTASPAAQPSPAAPPLLSQPPPASGLLLDAPTAPQSSLPAPRTATDKQTTFVSLIASLAKEYETASDEARRKSIRAKRKNALMELLPGRTVTAWKGRLTDVGTTSEGKTFVTVRLNDSDITVKTWNNALSDY
ncbi:MAG: hypothetical protein ACLGPL_00785, partial [Acidobacteriota bacterium]